MIVCPHNNNPNNAGVVCPATNIGKKITSIFKLSKKRKRVREIQHNIKGVREI
jgi:hypothetical protein